MNNAIRILWVTACVAGGLGWAGAKYDFEEKQRAAAEAERRTVDAERKKWADHFSGTVRSANGFEVMPEPAESSRGSAKLPAREWFLRVADVLDGGVYTPRPSGALMVVVPAYQFYRNETPSLRITFLGPTSLRVGGGGVSGDFTVDEKTMESLRGLIAEKAPE